MAANLTAQLADNGNMMAADITALVWDIATIPNVAAKGDLTKIIAVEVKGEILDLKLTMNTRLNRDLTTQARSIATITTTVVKNVDRTWKDLTIGVNLMASNLTDQVCNIAGVRTAMDYGDLSKKILVNVEGDVLDLSNTVNDMVGQLGTFAAEVTHVAKEVGMEGKLWSTVEAMDVSGVRIAATENDLHKLIMVEASGDMDSLKMKINQVLQNFSSALQKNRQGREAAEIANEVKSEYLTNMSHEILTPMNGMIGMTMLIRDSAHTDPAGKLINRQIACARPASCDCRSQDVVYPRRRYQTM
ncbi:histidine kinase osmosensor [Apophysomyces sp. BC1015]|nr:histidine kinase osmosensor [Apophysomyces sp. BC1015]